MYNPMFHTGQTVILNGMMQPTVGRMVYYNDNGQQVAAIIAYVWNDFCVNLMVIDRNGLPYSRTSVVQGSGTFQWDWMLYQRSQASESVEQRPKVEESR